MIKKDAVAGKNVKSLPIIDRCPMSVNFSCGIWTAVMERRQFILRRRRIPEHFTAGSLVKSGFYAASSDSFQNSGGTQTCDISGIFRCIKANPDVTLRAEVIDFVRTDIVQEIRQLRAV